MTRSSNRKSPASIRARLLNGAKERGEEFQRVLVRYGNERLLYRLSCSKHARHFVLKGATLFTIWTDVPHRSTKDIDLLGFGSPDLERLSSVLRDVLLLDVEPDGLRFEVDSLTVTPIREGHEYDGVRATFVAFLGAARIPIQVDVAFGDATAVPPVEVLVPTLLEGQPAPRLRAYQRELVVAEKFHVMVDLGLINTRLKDYFDLFVLCQQFSFDGPLLATAITTTFERRRTSVPDATPLGLHDDFAADGTKKTQWKAFLRRTGVSTEPSLASIVEQLRWFLMPPCLAIASSTTFGERWPEGGPWVAPADPT